MGDAFRHEALFYTDTEQFLEGTVPFLEAALEAGEPTLVAVGETKAGTLRGALGAAADDVRFVDMEELGRNPACIIPFWRDFVDERGGVDQPVRGIGEPAWPGRNEAEIDECHRHESLLNVAFAGAPAWRLLCPYDSSSLDDEVLEAARHNHPFLVQGTDSHQSPTWRPDCPPGPFDGPLEVRPSDVGTFRFDRGTLHEVRGQVGREATRQRLSAARCSDLVTAASELAANSILHGGGAGTLAVWEQDGALLVEIEDAGWIKEPLTGRLRPDPTQISGRGIWLANSLCDLVQIRSGPTGTAVRLRMTVDRR